jgi:2-iminobutanoate/2-iminopropanoate deaminase
MLERISPEGAPKPLGPYSPVVRAGDFIYLAGQGPLDAATNRLLEADIEAETRLTLTNIKTILKGLGLGLRDVVRVGVFLRDGADFAKMNEVYAEFFGNDKPARTTIVCSFAQPIRVEIDCVAYQPAR